MESSSSFGSTSRSLSSSGVARDRTEQSSELRKTLLPVPVAPATSRCGIFARSVWVGFPKMSLPSAMLSLEELERKESASSRSRM